MIIMKFNICSNSYQAKIVSQIPTNKDQIIAKTKEQHL